MTTNNTQELDDAPDLSDTHTIVDIPGFGKVWAVNDIATYYDTWLDWHNKQVGKARLNEVQNAYEYWINGRKFISSYFRDRIALLSNTKEIKDE